MDGHSPKTAKSESESSSAPNLLHELNRRAKRPSVASKNAAMTTAMTACSQFSTSANLTCIMPNTNAESVARFGTIFPTGMFSKIFLFLYFTRHVLEIKIYAQPSTISSALQSRLICENYAPTSIVNGICKIGKSFKLYFDVIVNQATASKAFR